jgi:plastocyanin
MFIQYLYKMNTLHLAIIVVYVVAIIIGIFLFESNQKNPITTMQTNQTNTVPTVSHIIIPPGAEDPSSGKNYEPRYLVVVLGVNNTVRWTNESPSDAHTIVARNQDDPLFWNATRSVNGALLLPGKSFNFSFTKVGEFQYDTEPHPWMYGWVLVLPQSAKDAIQTVTLNASSGVPDPCETFTMPCPFHPNNYNYTVQKFDSDIYIEKVTGNGVDHYAIIKPDKTCYYPPTVSNSCTNPDDLAILRLVGVNTSIPQENLHVALTGLAPSYLVGTPIDFGISIKGYGHCDIPSVLITHDGYIDWQSKTSWPSDTTQCLTGMHPLDRKYDLGYVGGPFYLNKSGTYLVHVGYSSNMTEEKFNVTSQEGQGTTAIIYSNGTYAGFSFDYYITGHNKLLGSTLDNTTRTIILSTHAAENGNLTVTLTPDLVNLLEQGKNENLPIVLDDEHETKYAEHLSNQNLIMTIPFQNGTSRIQIIGTSQI